MKVSGCTSEFCPVILLPTAVSVCPRMAQNCFTITSKSARRSRSSRRHDGAVAAVYDRGNMGGAAPSYQSCPDHAQFGTRQGVSLQFKANAFATNRTRAEQPVA